MVGGTCLLHKEIETLQVPNVLCMPCKTRMIRKTATVQRQKKSFRWRQNMAKWYVRFVSFCAILRGRNEHRRSERELLCERSQTQTTTWTYNQTRPLTAYEPLSVVALLGQKWALARGSWSVINKPRFSRKNQEAVVQMNRSLLGAFGLRDAWRQVDVFLMLSYCWRVPGLEHDFELVTWPCTNCLKIPLESLKWGGYRLAMVYRCAMVNRSWIKIPKEQTKPLRDHSDHRLRGCLHVVLSCHFPIGDCSQLQLLVHFFWISEIGSGSVHWVTEWCPVHVVLRSTFLSQSQTQRVA
jgi:hypothetical protein